MARLNQINSDTLKLEETLLILQECLLHTPSTLPLTPIAGEYIDRLKTFYSPQFDFDHSESGSFFFAALRSVQATFIDKDSPSHIPLSDNFIQSIEYLLEISMLSLSYRTNRSAIVEQLITLSNLWKLNRTLDMRSVIVQVLGHMLTEMRSKSMEKIS